MLRAKFPRLPGGSAVFRVALPLIALPQHVTSLRGILRMRFFISPTLRMAVSWHRPVGKESLSCRMWPRASNLQYCRAIQMT